MSIVASIEPRIERARVTRDEIIAELADGRVISVPLAWSWRLSDATPAERKNFRLIGPGYGIHWPDLDEDISVEGLLHGIPARRPNPGSQVLRSADAAPRHKRAPSARRPTSIR